MNVQEILSISKERKTKSKQAIKKIVENIHKKILHYAQMKKEFCSYIVPPIVDDTILYDREAVIKDIYKILDDEGYIVSAYSNGQIDICWNEKMVEQKIKSDAALLKQEEQRLTKLSNRSKQVYDRFSVLANPKKVSFDKSVDDILNEQVQKVLKEKERKQKKFSKIVGNFNKI